MNTSKANTSFLYVTLLIILLSSSIALFVRSSAFTIETFVVTGVSYIPVAEIEQLAIGVKGENLLLYDQDQLREKIKLHPFVGEVTFKRDFPHTLVIEVSERNPAALVVVGNGVIEVDSQGTFLRRFESWPSSDKPVITGVTIPETAGPGQLLNNSLLGTALNVINEAPAALLPLIGEIHVNPVSQITMMLMNGVEVRLGYTNSWSDKLDALVQLIDDQGYRSIEKEVRYIDFTAARPVIGRY